MAGNHRTCEICGLQERHLAGNQFYAKFPLDEVKCKAWVKIVGKEDLVYLPIEKLHSSRYVCGRHFKNKDFSKSRKMLKRRAIPQLLISAKPLPEELLTEFPLHVSSYRKGSNKTVLHSFPNPSTEPEKFRNWVSTVGGDLCELDDLYVHKYRKICAAHFEEKFITAGKRLFANAVPTLHVTGNATAKTAHRTGEREHERPGAEHLSPSTSQRHTGLPRVSAPALTGSLDAPQMPSEETLLSMDESRLSLLGFESYDGTEEVVEETVVADDGDYVQDDVSPTAEPPPEGGPFSWQRSSIPVPCDAGTDGVIDLEEEPEVFMYEDGGAPARGAADKGAGEVETEYDLEHHYKCNSCDTLISGPRYTCVQCADYDMCGACDARGAHAFHYVLRVPQHRPHGDLQAVLQTIRRVLLSDGVIQLDDARVKSEVKEELPDPIAVELVSDAPDGGDARALAGGGEEDASDTEAESQARTDTEEDVTDDDATWAPQSLPEERESPRATVGRTYSRRLHTRSTNLDIQDGAVMPQTKTLSHQPQPIKLPRVVVDRTQKRVQLPLSSMRRYGIERISTEAPDKAKVTIKEIKPGTTLKLVSTLQKVNPSMLQFGTTKRKLNAVGPGTPGNAKVRVLNPSEVSYVDMARATAPAHAARVAGASDGRTLERAGLVEPDGTAVKVTNLVKQVHVNLTRLREGHLRAAPRTS